MVLPSDQIPPDRDWITAKIRDLEQAIEQLRAARAAEATTIGRGGLKIVDDGSIKLVDDNGHTILYAGPDSQGRQIFELRRENGQLVLRTFYLGTGQQVWALHDRSGRLVASDDGISGAGLAEPWIPVPIYAKAYPNAFLDTLGTDLTVPVSACSGAAVWEGRIGKVSHPKIQYDGVFGRVTGVSGNPTYTFKVNGVTLDSFSQTTYGPTARGPFDVSNLLGFSNVAVQLTLSATGTGTDRVAAQPNAVYLRQT
ncbi:MAG: hypothetical protein ACJ72N_19815 [Labedaea sp.]